MKLHPSFIYFLWKAAAFILGRKCQICLVLLFLRKSNGKYIKSEWQYSINFWAWKYLILGNIKNFMHQINNSSNARNFYEKLKWMDIQSAPIELSIPLYNEYKLNYIIRSDTLWKKLLHMLLNYKNHFMIIHEWTCHSNVGYDTSRIFFTPCIALVTYSVSVLYTVE